MPYAQDIIDDSRSYADSLFSQAQSFLNGWATEYVVPRTTRIDLKTDTTAPTLSTPPTFTGNAPNMALSYTRPVFETMYIPATPVMPTAPAALDTSDLFLTPKPAYDIPAFTATVPTVSVNSTLPATPTVRTIDAPTITDPTIPTAPAVTIPQFSSAFRGTDLTPANPTALSRFQTSYGEQPELIRGWIDRQVGEWVNQYQPEYYTALNALETKLTEAYAGTIVPLEVEQAMFDRARYRAELELQKAEREITEGYTKRGYALPPGAMVTARMQVQQATAANLGAQATEVAIERLKMEIQHMQFAMDISSKLRMAMIQAAISYGQTLVQVNREALDAAKSLAQIAIDEYNQRIAVFNAYLDYWKTEVAVYEIQMKSALAVLEEYRIRLESAKLEVEVDQIQVNLYAAEIDAEMKKIQTYAAQVDAIVKAASLEEIKIKLFGAQVDAYAAQVKAKEAEYGVYTAAIQGDTAQIQGYVAEVNAYSAMVDAKKAVASVDIAHADVIVKYNDALNERFKAEVQAESERIRALGLEFTTEVEAYKAALESVRMNNEAKLQTLQADLELDKIRFSAQQINYQGAVNERNVDSQYYSNLIQTRATEINAKAEIAGQLAGAAVTAASGIVSYSEFGTTA